MAVANFIPDHDAIVDVIAREAKDVQGEVDAEST